MDTEADSIKYLKTLVAKFRDERDWKRYHNPKDLAISIMIEAAELLELFQWRSEDEINELIKNEKFINAIKKEMADILIYFLSLADVLNIDLGIAVIEKLKENSIKYPAESASGEKFRKILDKRLNISKD